MPAAAPMSAVRPAPAPAGIATERAPGWWRTILVIGPLCWSGVFLIEVTNMEAWRIANAELQVVSPATRAVQYLLLLPFLLLAFRTAVAVGAARWPLALRATGQLALAVAFSMLARPVLVTAAALTRHHELAAGIAESLAFSTREGIAVWIASITATAMNYAAALGVVVGVKTYRDLESERVVRANVERAAIAARLQALTNQLTPHFLFNVLNTIVSLIESQPRLAQSMVTRFADLLRRILNDGATQFVPLARELELVEQYVEIQKLRFPQRLSHERCIEPGTAGALVPALVMQPIIENAVVHGLRHGEGPVRVRIETTATVQALEIRVSNDGPPAPAGSAGPVPGVGLRNVSERLATLFGPAAWVRLEVAAPGHYCTTVRLPLVQRVTLPGAPA